MNEGNYDPNMKGVLFKNDKQGNDKRIAEPETEVRKFLAEVDEKVTKLQELDRE